VSESRPLIVGLGGTLRSGSSSEQALSISLGLASARGADTTAFAGERLSLPLYNPERPAGSMSGEVSRLIGALRRADGLILVSPCYHGGISGLLKNAIDYIEEMRADERAYLDGLPVGCVGCGLGWQGPNQVISNLRSIVHSLRGWPTPLGVAINTVATRFVDGACLDDAVVGQLDIMVGQVVDFARLQMRKRKKAA
jgi:FMN reductase